MLDHLAARHGIEPTILEGQPAILVDQLNGDIGAGHVPLGSDDRGRRDIDTDHLLRGLTQNWQAVADVAANIQMPTRTRHSASNLLVGETVHQIGHHFLYRPKAVDRNQGMFVLGFGHRRATPLSSLVDLNGARVHRRPIQARAVEPSAQSGL